MNGTFKVQHYPSIWYIMEVTIFRELEDFLDPFLDPQNGPVRPDKMMAGRALIALDALIKNMPGVTEDRVESLKIMLQEAMRGRWTSMDMRIDDAVDQFNEIKRMAFDERILHDSKPQYLYSSSKSKSANYQISPRPLPKRPAYIDGFTLKNKPSDNDVINAEGTGSINNMNTRINRNPDDPLNREFTLDVIRSGTKIPPPTGQDLVNRNTLIKQEFKDIKSRYSELRIPATVPEISTRSYIPSQVLTNNPTKIADLFTKLFDVEWADAFEQVCRNRIGVPEVKIIVDLADILKKSFQYTREEARNLIDSMALRVHDTMAVPPGHTPYTVRLKERHHDYTLKRHAREIVKETADLSLNIIIKDFEDRYNPPSFRHHVIQQYDIDEYQKLDKVTRYLQKCVEVTWYMNVQDPPMGLLWPNTNENEISLNCFRHFTKFGNKLEHEVWPALLIHDQGPVIVKGVAQLRY
ncbi:unnamed protein product [Mytilus edulis]|uniref:Mitochondria-eating protein C-terminal domain-containing protein n=1 Tax=Mytilus edulis TaxID=6550 RepID=A0A8S3ULM6_MYTED|nr:unnamed protein product [Mytilus edulis]